MTNVAVMLTLLAEKGWGERMAINVILDSGIGDHFDDAFALALACRSPEIRLLGVTTTWYNAASRTLLARRLLGLYGRTDVAVATGRSPHWHDRPRSGAPRFTQQHLALARGPMAPEANGDAVDFMADILSKHTGVTLVATATPTNIGRLLQRYPALHERIARVICVGGWVSHALPDRNVREDPQAVQAMMESPVPLTFYGYEVTWSCILRRTHLSRMQACPLPGTQFLMKLFHSWRKEWPRHPHYVHDALAIAALCRPQLVQTKEAGVHLHHDVLSEEKDGRPVELATQVDVPTYLDMLVARLAPTPVETTDAPETEPSRTAADPATWVVTVRSTFLTQGRPGWSLSGRVDHHILLAVSAGTCLAAIHDATYEAASGAILYIPAETEYHLATDGPAELVWIHFDLAVRVADDRLEPCKSIVQMPTCFPADSSSRALVDRAISVQRLTVDPWPEAALLRTAKTLELLAELQGRARGLSANDVKEDAVLWGAKRFIETHRARPLTLDEVSEHVNMSPYHLSRRFQDCFGSSPMSYHRYLRIQLAQSYLRTHGLTVAETARRLGYSSPNALSRAFHKEVGVPPSEYRS